MYFSLENCTGEERVSGSAAVQGLGREGLAGPLYGDCGTCQEHSYPHRPGKSAVCEDYCLWQKMC